MIFLLACCIKQKDVANRIILVQGDALKLSYIDDCFDVVCCSHALYELKGQVRTDALKEMRRVVKPDGMVLIMEHEVPRNPLVKILFHMRMLMMGSTDSREFLIQDLCPYQKIFANVSLSHTPSGKSKLIICRKKMIHDCDNFYIFHALFALSIIFAPSKAVSDANPESLRPNYQ